MNRRAQRLPTMLLLGAGVALALGGCSSDSGESPSGPSSSTSGTGSAADGEGSGGLSGGGGADAAAGPDGADPGAGPTEPEPFVPGPTVELDDPELLEITEWRIASYFDPSEASFFFEALDAGVLVYPEGNTYGAFWLSVVPGEDGSFALPGAGSYVYGITKIEVEEPTSVLILPNRISSMRLDDQRQPGDPYGSSRHRVPLRLEAGENLVVFTAFRGNSDPRIQMWRVDDEVAFVPSDATSPEILEGDTETTYYGLPVLNLGEHSLGGALAKVVASELFEATEHPLWPLPPGATSGVPFVLKPTEALAAPGEEEEDPRVTLRIEAPDLELSYEREVAIKVLPAGHDGARRVTFLSSIDGTVQYYGLLAPPEPKDDLALILSLHGAGVQGKGQAGSYGAKDWAWIVAPTNRRPFGFDWESFGRLDGLEILDLAMERYSIDPTKVYVSGHSMGGHGTWQFGTLFPGRFALVGPSAGWPTFETYGGVSFPSAPFGWAALSSNTFDFVTNLAKRAVYVIHGTADDNVPPGQAELMIDAMEGIVSDLQVHWEEGAGHWWDGDDAPGAACVDWPPMMETIEERALDPTELDFHFTSAGPQVNPSHSYATIRSTVTPANLATLESTLEGDEVSLVVSNVRSLILDGAALAAKDVSRVVVTDTGGFELGDVSIEADSGDLEVGPQTGKRPHAHGPLVQAFQSPFCVVWDEAGSAAYKAYAQQLVSTWNIIGNGGACGVPISEVSEQLLAERSMVYIGLSREVLESHVELPEELPFDFDELAMSANGVDYPEAAMAFVYPAAGSDGDRLMAVMTTTPGREGLLYGIQPFNSRFWMTDWVVWTSDGAAAAGFYDATWSISLDLSVP